MTSIDSIARLRAKFLDPKNYNKLSTYDKTYPPDTYGFWRIRGETTDRESPPDLGVVEGAYGNVVDYALYLRDFITWGGGGYIEKIEITKITPEMLAKIPELLEEREALQNQLKETEAQLARINKSLKFNENKHNTIERHRNK